ncbi:MAG TPA: UDP-N-acetylmuramoyl-L-alanine--D-glutamate ligase [Candidatus Paceibacterota bacterium]|nr:UDP-N-acetylmuramoyl-L-alanine--D-glutamate ligase [Candidatus Paceibacterota bacterium]
MKIAILGFAREGHSVLNFLKKDGAFKNAEIWILDENPKIEVPVGLNSATGAGYLKNLSRFDIIFRTPGIPYLLPEIQKVKNSGVKISSATNLFLERCPGTIIGITGTKGKGTVSTLLYEILKACPGYSRRVFLAGNIGKPALDVLPKMDKKSIAIFELSSFQLQDIKISPSVAVVLDIFPDHLDAHKSLNEYYEAKTNIARYQKNGDRTFFFKNIPLSRKVAAKGKGRKIGVDEKTFKIFSPDDILIRGSHNFKNAVMAAEIAKSLGVPEKIIARTVRGFRGTEHRLEFVRALSKNGKKICFYNDSASTNPQTAAAAINAFPDEEKILIAGGQDKNLDYKPLAEALKSDSRRAKTELVILFGENKNKIKAAIKKSGIKTKIAAGLKDSVDIAYKAAREFPFPSLILFSPAATSFDMFKNYSDRGEKFKKIVMGLIQ